MQPMNALTQYLSSASVVLVFVMSVIMNGTTRASACSATIQDAPDPSPQGTGLLGFSQVAELIKKRAETGELLEVRSAWPASHQVRASVSLGELNARSGAVFRVLDIRDRVLHEVLIRSYHDMTEPDPTWRDSTFSIPWSCISGGEIHLRYQLMDSEESEIRDAPQSISGDVLCPILIVESDEQAIIPASSSALDKLLALETTIELVKSGSKHIARIYMPQRKWPEDTALAFDVLFFSEGRLIGKGYYWWKRSDSSAGNNGEIYLPIEIDWRAVSKGEPISVVIIGSAEIALRDVARRKYWHGGVMLTSTVDFGRFSE